MKPLTWREITRDCWVASLPGGVSIAVNRKRSWKKIPDARPWKPTVLGNQFACPDGFEDLEDAKRATERLARKAIAALAAWARKVTP